MKMKFIAAILLVCSTLVAAPELKLDATHWRWVGNYTDTNLLPGLLTQLVWPATGADLVTNEEWALVSSSYREDPIGACHILWPLMKKRMLGVQWIADDRATLLDAPVAGMRFASPVRCAGIAMPPGNGQYSQFGYTKGGQVTGASIVAWFAGDRTSSMLLLAWLREQQDPVTGLWTGGDVRAPWDRHHEWMGSAIYAGDLTQLWAATLLREYGYENEFHRTMMGLLDVAAQNSRGDPPMWRIPYVFDPVTFVPRKARNVDPAAFDMNGTACWLMCAQDDPQFTADITPALRWVNEHEMLDAQGVPLGIWYPFWRDDPDGTERPVWPSRSAGTAGHDDVRREMAVPGFTGLSNAGVRIRRRFQDGK